MNLTLCKTQMYKHVQDGVFLETTMDNKAIEKLLEFIAQEWRSLEERFQPPSVWVRLHEPVELGVDQNIDTPIQRAWFLNGFGFKERRTDEFSRLAAVHFDRPWWKGFSSPPISDMVKKHGGDFGFVAFAQYKDTSDCYLELIWGGLYGRAYKIGFKNESVVIRNELWRS